MCFMSLADDARLQAFSQWLDDYLVECGNGCGKEEVVKERRAKESFFFCVDRVKREKKE